MIRSIFLSTAFFFLCQSISAQQIDSLKYDQLFKDRTKNNSSLFLHCDKTLYTNNETIWFTAYLSSGDSQFLETNDVLSVFLILEGSSKIVVSEQYFMQSGIAFGSVELPDTIPPGNYKLVAYSNTVDASNLPVVTFTQNLTIKTTIQQKFSAEIKVLPISIASSTIELQINVKGLPALKNGKYPSASITYHLNDKLHTAESNENGMFSTFIPTKSIDPLRNRFYAEVKFNNEVKHLSVVLPGDIEKKLDVKFYPEGGELTDGIKGVVGIEALTKDGRPAIFKGIVYEGQLPIDTIETDATGFAKLILTPKYGAEYYLKPFGENVLANASRFNFPAICSDYPVLFIQNALVDDSLSLILKSKTLSEFNVIVQQSGVVFLDFKVTANAHGRPIKVPLTDIPRGLASVIVCNIQGVPLAERLFYAHYHRKNSLSISTESEEFGKRQKVNLKLKMNNIQGMVDGAIVSVACVQTSRLESSKFQDIESYSYVASKLEEGAFNPLGKVYLGNEYLENVLLIKGWRRFKDRATNDSLSLRSLEFTGTITRIGRKIFEPISFTVLRDSLFNVQTSDQRGFFKLSTENLLHGYGRRGLFSVNKANKQLFSVRLVNPFRKTDSLLTGIYNRNGLSGLSTVQNSDSLIMDSKILKLKEVVISGKKGNQIYGKSAKNECGDFVCPYGLLNCGSPGHDKEIGAYSPVVGERYKIRIKTSSTSFGIITTIYSGCLPTSKVAGSFQGVLYSREFYVNDYTDKNLPETDNQSTIYWNHSITVNGNGTEFSFYTSDINGVFRIVVQGMSTSGPVFATKEIKVR